ncbi:glycosyltransferase [Citrobacter sp. RHBSTW-00271]|uniref:glycosyltransferase n=1 Tax=Citrobacter sp. RHBSTW-00271 TaxID=2742642 RepID=UPI0012BA1309|nr:glycosyltransferase [Citrobacter sp. RHBSTW-00271]MBA7941546.1 glycosyltransferase [Citrobacter sp. RHBSTW-00271]HEF0063180.1 glycosyltransferase [Citrobacter pasteurii]
MQLKKIIITGYETSGLGGMETVCINLVRLLRTQDPDIDVSFVFFKKNNNSNVNNDWLTGQRYCHLSSNIKITKLRRLSFAYGLRKIILQESPDIIISLDTLSCYISHVARKYTSKQVKIFSWFHFSIFNFYKNNYKKKIKYINKADYHLSISSGITQQLIEMGIEKSTIATIYNPVARCDIRIPTPEKHARFVYVGRVVADGQKNVRSLFNGLAKLKGKWSLDIIGTGPDVDTLTVLAETLGISGNIHWHGWQKSPWEYIQNTLKNITCLLLTSHFEGFVMVLVEASAHGVYAISSDCETGPADIIKEGINGNLYPTDEPEKFVSLLQGIVDGKALPAGEQIQQAIEEFYEDNYIIKVNKAFAMAGFTIAPSSVSQVIDDATT